MPKDFEGIRKSIDRLKELGVPSKVIDDLNAWLESERKKDPRQNARGEKHE